MTLETILLLSPRGRHCWGGLDLSSTTGLTTFALLFEPVGEDPEWRLLTGIYGEGSRIEAA